MKVKHKYFLSDTLALTFNKRYSALSRPDSYRELSGVCGNYLLSQPTAFHSIRRSGGVYSLLIIVF
jgi:hypothetical protein